MFAFVLASSSHDRRRQTRRRRRRRRYWWWWWSSRGVLCVVVVSSVFSVEAPVPVISSLYKVGPHNALYSHTTTTHPPPGTGRAHFLEHLFFFLTFDKTSEKCPRFFLFVFFFRFDENLSPRLFFSSPHSCSSSNGIFKIKR